MSDVNASRYTGVARKLQGVPEEEFTNLANAVFDIISAVVSKRVKEAGYIV